MIVAMMQPTFLPWAGYFALVDASDRFVFLDDFQFQRQSFHQRNRLFVGRDEIGWISVPVAHAGRQEFPLLCEVRPVLEGRFRSKLIRQLTAVYRGSHYLEAVLSSLQPIIDESWGSLAALNQALILELCRLIGIETRFVCSSALGSSGHRSERVAELLRKVGADAYLSAAGAEQYLREDGIFPLRDIETRFQRYSPVRYQQRLSSEFQPYLSVLDMLLQIGPEASLEVIRAGHTESAPWRADGVMT